MVILQYCSLRIHNWGNIYNTFHAFITKRQFSRTVYKICKIPLDFLCVFSMRIVKAWYMQDRSPSHDEGSPRQETILGAYAAKQCHLYWIQLEGKCVLSLWGKLAFFSVCKHPANSSGYEPIHMLSAINISSCSRYTTSWSWKLYWMQYTVNGHPNHEKARQKVQSVFAVSWSY